MKHFAYNWLYSKGWRQVKNTNWLIRKEHLNKPNAVAYWSSISHAIFFEEWNAQPNELKEYYNKVGAVKDMV